jgi:hypothetical protein
MPDPMHGDPARPFDLQEEFEVRDPAQAATRRGLCGLYAPDMREA